MSQNIEHISNVEDCASEPIHIPGSIQSHGALLVIEDESYRIVQVSANTRELLGYAPDDLLQHTLDLFLDEEAMDLLRNTSRDQLERNPLFLFTIVMKGGTQAFDGVVHVLQNLLILELEPVRTTSAQGTTSSKLYATIQSAFSQLQLTTSVQSLSQRVVKLIRQFTGFDRVMMYRFADDGHGVVIAEEKRDDMEPFLDLHYPESDIPQQARALYVKNWLRIIPDIRYKAIPLVPTLNPVTQSILDMSHAVLRSVSPVHLEYLSNMGVSASMSISVVQNNKLWGLIACHNDTPRYISYDQRTACELLGRLMSMQLPAIAEQESASYAAQMTSIRARLIEFVSQQPSLEKALTANEPNLLDLVNASGAALYSDNKSILIGQTPTRDEVQRLVQWLIEQPEQEVYSIDRLGQEFPLAQAWTKYASGLLAIVLSRELHSYLLWFRSEVIKTVQWGGEPIKIVTPTVQGARFSPRKSFEVWSETVRGQSQPWQAAEIKSCVLLRNGVIETMARHAEELRKLNQALARSNAELDAFTYIASHDLKEPLRGIHNYAHFLLEDYEHVLEPEGVDQLQTITRLSSRMEDLINSLLYYSQLGRIDVKAQQTDINKAIHDALALLKVRLEENNVHIELKGPFPTILGDPNRISEIYQNLIGNALKYSDKERREIEIGVILTDTSSESTAARYTFYVRDNGIGISSNHFENIFRIYRRLHGRNEYGGGTGVGLTIVKRIVELHGGHIWLESTEKEGTTFFFTLGA